MTADFLAVGRLRLAGRARGSVSHPRTLVPKPGVLRLKGRATLWIPGKIATGAHGYLLLKGTAGGSVNAPYGSFGDFSHYGIGAVDPAQVLVGANNGGLTSLDANQMSGYRRYFAVLSAPQDYSVSGEGKKAWSRAAYASVGLKFKGLVTNGFQIIDGAQFEISRYRASMPLPFQPARSLNSTLSAVRSNLAFNPAAVTTNAVVDVPGLGLMPNVTGFNSGSDAVAWQSTAQVFIGTNSVAIDWVGSDPAITRSGYDVSGLTIGTPYVALMMVWREIEAPIVAITPDGELIGEEVLATEGWVETRVTFVAAAETQRVGLIRRDPEKNGRTYIGGVVITTAPYEGGYFDGFSGPDFTWGGTVNDATSLYFPDKVIRSYLISQLLQENCPWGVTPNIPEFGKSHAQWILGDSDRSILGTSTIC